MCTRWGCCSSLRLVVASLQVGAPRGWVGAETCAVILYSPRSTQGLVCKALFFPGRDQGGAPAHECGLHLVLHFM